MKDLKQSYFIKASPKEVWAALTDADHISHWGGGKAKMKPEPNFEFELWDGDIYGTNLEVLPYKKLSQYWYAYDWDQPSKVTFTLTTQDNGTRVDLDQSGVPDREYEEIAIGWDEHYLGKIKQYLEQV